MEITSQNHNCRAVSQPNSGFWTGPADRRDTVRARAMTHTSLNDESVEGMMVSGSPGLSVQYHPEASPGPHDSAYLFEQFVTLMETPP